MGQNIADWKKVTLYLPYVSGLVVVFGLLRQASYYHYYQIEIQNFIGISELLLAWMDEMYSFLSFLVFIILSLATDTYIAEYVYEWPLKKKNRQALIWRMIASFVLFIVFFTIPPGVLALFLLVGLLLPISLFPAYIIVNNFFQDTLGWGKLNLTVFKFIYGSVFSILLIFNLTRKAISEVNEGNYYGTTITTEDSVYISNSNSTYIGKTEKYYFIFNKEDSSSTIIPSDEVILFKLKSKRYSPIKNAK